MKKIGPGEVRALKLPKSSSHKGDNGKLLIIAGSEKYHGSLIYAIKAASKIVDLIYVLTTRENQGLVRKLKERTAEFISVRFPLTSILSRQGRGKKGEMGRGREALFDCILIGPGMGRSKRTYNLVKAVLRSKIRAVLDADALNILDKKLLKLLDSRHILTPHRGEFGRLLGVSSISPLPPPLNLPLGQGEKGEGDRGGGKVLISALKKFVKQYGCTVVLKGKVDIVATPSQSPPIRGTGGEIYYNYTGNAGMTKGGTGDVLAGLIAAFYSRNEAFISAAAGVFINGRAGNELYKKAGPYYNAEDLVEEIPFILWSLRGVRYTRTAKQSQ